LFLDAGHYHKDAGNEGPEHEYRLVHAMRMYAQAVRVASKYRYEGVDSIQLNKHTSAAAMLIVEDIMTPKGENNKDARLWTSHQNAVAFCTWLVAFFDSLLSWEEQSDGKQFVEILSPHHKFSIGKLFQLLSVDVRKDAITLVDTGEGGVLADASEDLPSFRQPRSKRMRRSGLLIQALQKPKVAIREMELAISEEPSDSTDGRRSKRRRR
jgi:hypothetical protein